MVTKTKSMEKETLQQSFSFVFNLDSRKRPYVHYAVLRERLVKYKTKETRLFQKMFCPTQREQQHRKQKHKMNLKKKRIQNV